MGTIALVWMLINGKYMFTAMEVPMTTTGCTSFQTKMKLQPNVVKVECVNYTDLEKKIEGYERQYNCGLIDGKNYMCESGPALKRTSNEVDLVTPAKPILVYWIHSNGFQLLAAEQMDANSCKSLKDDTPLSEDYIHRAECIASLGQFAAIVKKGKCDIIHIHNLNLKQGAETLLCARKL